MEHKMNIPSLLVNSYSSIHITYFTPLVISRLSAGNSDQIK